MTGARILVLAAAAGCGFPTPSEDYACTTNADCAGHAGTVCGTSGYCVVSASGSDAGPSDTVDGTTPFDCHQWTPLPMHFDPCMIPVPSGDLILSTAGTYRYDTTTGTLTAPGGGTSQPPHLIVRGAQLISVSSFQLAATANLRVVGDKPLIVASWSSIDVSGVIDLTSNLTELGAGANPVECGSHAAIAGTSNSGGGGGGGGGGFQGTGGTGGKGNNTTVGGLGGGPVAPPSLLGGCAGAAGGAGSTPGALGGGGGGAIELAAHDSITINGAINAGGSGGHGATTNLDDSSSGPGGGGGGSGGMIFLDATNLDGSGVIAANGGGGGEGADSSAGQLPGQDGMTGLASNTPARGGAQNVAGDGGTGSSAVTLDGGAGTLDATDGGGGGGGGAGYIVVHLGTSSFGGVVTPTPTQL